MAVDTRDKRGSALGEFGFTEVLPLPDNSVSQGDRQQVAWVYRGISADAPVVISAGHYHDLHSNREQYPALTAADSQYSTLHAAREQYPGLDNDDR